MSALSPAVASLAAAGILLVASPAHARPWWTQGSSTSNDSDFLPPDVAFKPSIRIDGNVLRVRWLIADGYYLYRRRFEIAADSPGLEVSALKFPPGESKTDAFLGAQEVFHHVAEGTSAFSRFDAGAHPLQVRVTYQGCAEAGLCYLPISRVISPSSAAPAAARSAIQPWTGWGIVAGFAAFLLAGSLLRKEGRPRVEGP